MMFDYVANAFAQTPSKKLVEILYKTDRASEMTVPIGATEPWPCTSKGFLANTNGEIMPEYKSGYFKPSIGEVYLVGGTTGSRQLIATYDKIEGILMTLYGNYWTKKTVNLLKGE